MCVNFEAYHIRIGTFMINYIKELTTGVCEEMMMGKQIRFLRLVLTVFLVTGGVELNPGPPVNQGKIDQIVVHVQKIKTKKCTIDLQPRK
jgi:hypothetical protein